jgi:(p)ppGpp synthase/HD superfamily hydrolase
MKITHPKDFAIKAHGDQKYGDSPYKIHLVDVVSIVEKGCHFITHDEIEKSIIVSAAWLHDVLEDTSVSYETLRYYFGKNVADLVDAVTDEPGKNRKERKAKTLPKIREFGKSAVFLKLCDRLANICNCIDGNPGLLKMYKKEHQQFYNALYDCNDKLDWLWEYLSGLTVEK